MSPEAFLQLATTMGAVITGKPDGSEPVSVTFTPEAWREFSKDALGTLAEADRRAGAAERELASVKKDLAVIHAMRSRMKREWGVSEDVSFDIVWQRAIDAKEMMDWLDQNIFHVEPDEWTRKFSPHLNTWRIFAPEGVQGSARAIIGAAIKAQSKPDTHTTWHCKEQAKPGGCQLHNLQCGWPECDIQPNKPKCGYLHTPGKLCRKCGETPPDPAKG